MHIEYYWREEGVESLAIWQKEREELSKSTLDKYGQTIARTRIRESEYIYIWESPP